MSIVKIKFCISWVNLNTKHLWLYCSYEPSRFNVVFRWYWWQFECVAEQLIFNIGIQKAAHDIHTCIYIDMWTLNIKRKAEICVQQKRYMPQPATQPTSQNMHANTFRFLRGKAAKRTKINYSTGIVRAATAALKRKKKKEICMRHKPYAIWAFFSGFYFSFFFPHPNVCKNHVQREKTDARMSCENNDVSFNTFLWLLTTFTSDVRVCVYNLRMRYMKKKNHSVNKA